MKKLCECRYKGKRPIGAGQPCLSGNSSLPATIYLRASRNEKAGMAKPVPNFPESRASTCIDVFERSLKDTALA
jgi:hypothetical protein